MRRFLQFDRQSRVIDIIICAGASVAIIMTSLLTKSFWGDEILSIKFAQRQWQEFFTSLASDYHPPLYFLLLRSWISLFGDWEMGLRILQGAQGFALLFLSLDLFRRMLPSSRIHPYWILFILSSELWLFLPMARYYILAATLVVLSTILLLLWLEHGNVIRSFMLLISYVLILYTDYPSSVILVIHLLFVVLWHRQVLSMLFKIIGGAAIAFLPWAVVTIHQVQRLLSEARYADLNMSPFAVVVKLLYSVYAFIFGETIYPFEIIVIVGCLVLIVSLVVNLKMKYLSLKEGILFPLFVVLGSILFTSLITTIVSTHTSFIYTPSRTLFALPFVFMLFAVVHESCKNSMMRKLLFVTLLLVNLYGIFNLFQNRHVMNPVYASPWKEIIHDMAGERGLLLVDEGLCYEYYMRQYKTVSPRLARVQSLDDFKQELQRTSNHEVMLVLSGRESTQSEIPDKVLEYVSQHGRKVYERKYVVLDEQYRMFKSKILKCDTYDAKFTIVKYNLDISL